MGTQLLCADEAIAEHVAAWVLQPSSSDEKYYVLYCPLCRCAVSQEPEKPAASPATRSPRLRRLAKRFCRSCGRDLPASAMPAPPIEVCVFCRDLQKR